MSRIYDISVPIRSGGVIYPATPPISITAQQAISQGAGANVSRLDFGSHTGTHVDAPKHFFDDGAGVDALPLDLLLGRARVVEITKRGGIGRDDLAGAGLREDLRALLKTSKSALWNGEG